MPSMPAFSAITVRLTFPLRSSNQISTATTSPISASRPDSRSVVRTLPDQTNIMVGANLLNGHLIPPKSTFSFNHAIGIITEDAGFVESNVVDGERIGRDVGGGICQVSTTVFRAAFRAGLPITEWHPHRYRM